MSTENKIIAEKIQMFFNLIFHIDDYIKNKKERKDQLNVSKSIRLILREIITSKVNLNLLITNVDLKPDNTKKKSKEEIQQEKAYIKAINPLSFNQKNLNNINLFYDTNNEIFIINYLILDKILSVVRFCFWEIIKQKNSDLGKILAKKNTNLVLGDLQNDVFANDDCTNEENVLRKMIKKKFYIENIMHNENKIKLTKIKKNNFKKNKFKWITNHTVDYFKSIKNNYNLNNINNIANNLVKTIDRNDEVEKTKELYFKNQIRAINKEHPKLNKEDNINCSRALKMSPSLPLIYDKKKFNYKLNSYYKEEKEKKLNKMKTTNKTRNNRGRNKYLYNNLKLNSSFKNEMLKKYYLNNKYPLIEKK